MTVSVIRARIQRHVAFVVHDARRVSIAVRIQVVNAADTAVNHRDSDARTVPAAGVREVAVHGRDHFVEGATNLAVRRNVNYSGV